MGNRNTLRLSLWRFARFTRLVMALCALLLAFASPLNAQEAGVAADTVANTANTAKEQALASAGLVEVVALDPKIRLDIKYATTDNFVKRKVYESARCFLQRPVATALVAANTALTKLGYQLLVHDCYRPFSVQKVFWKLLPDSRFVARPVEKNGKPIKGSRHNRGAAVDVTLVSLDGSTLEMPTAYDAALEKASPESKHHTAGARANLAILRKAMMDAGFRPIKTEWWHYDGPGHDRYPLLDLAL